jgi:hypothetical protein
MLWPDSRREVPRGTESRREDTGHRGRRPRSTGPVRRLVCDGITDAGAGQEPGRRCPGPGLEPPGIPGVRLPYPAQNPGSRPGSRSSYPWRSISTVREFLEWETRRPGEWETGGVGDPETGRPGDRARSPSGRGSRSRPPASLRQAGGRPRARRRTRCAGWSCRSCCSWPGTAGPPLAPASLERGTPVAYAVARRRCTTCCRGWETDESRTSPTTRCRRPRRPNRAAASASSGSDDLSPPSRSRPGG